MKLSEIFDECAQRVAEGWSGNGTGYCASVHISQVTGDVPTSAAQVMFAHAIGGLRFTDTWKWNDDPERTQAEVVAMFHALAMTERAREARLLPVCQSEVVLELSA